MSDIRNLTSKPHGVELRWRETLCHHYDILSHYTTLEVIFYTTLKSRFFTMFFTESTRGQSAWLPPCSNVLAHNHTGTVTVTAFWALLATAGARLCSSHGYLHGCPILLFVQSSELHASCRIITHDVAMATPESKCSSDNVTKRFFARFL